MKAGNSNLTLEINNMSKIYLVWYRLKDASEDIIRGAALNWERAENMAMTLELNLKALGLSDFEFGVKSYEHGSLPFDIINNDGCFGRWQQEEFGE